jgi:raffinose/stachyose/melibiose transport system permease protein
MLVYSTLVAYPVITALGWSFFSWNGLQRNEFVGLDNYRALFDTYPYDTQLLTAVYHNTAFFVGTSAFEYTIGLGLALLIFDFSRGRRFFQIIYSTPYLISPIIIGYIWSLLLSPAFGPASAGFKDIGLNWLARSWLGDPGTALPVTILISCWQFVGFPILLFGAALAGIPQECLDAAAVDGAGWLRRHLYITIPLLTPALGVVGILTFINTFNVFDLVYALGGSNGAPVGSLDVLGLLFYRVAFGGGSNSVGVSSALSVMLFGFVFLFSFAANKWLQSRSRSLS